MLLYVTMLEQEILPLYELEVIELVCVTYRNAERKQGALTLGASLAACITENYLSVILFEWCTHVRSFLLWP
jgi:hypothetical protein